MRKKIKLDMSMIDVYVEMSEGNPGAISVLRQMDPIDVLTLDDMNIRGGQIWVGFKDHCKQNITEFISKVKSRDEAMIKTINETPGFSEKAVRNGGSWKHG